MKGQRGFNLLEVILSFFIISIVLLVLINLYPMSYVSMRRGEHLLAGDAIAHDLLERARAADYEGLVVGSTTPSPPVMRGSLEYRPVMTVNEIAGVDPDIAREVVVRVQWTEKGAGVQQVTHRLYVTRVPE